MTHSFYILYGKRFLDLLSSTCGLLLLFPFLALVAVAVKLSSPGPIFFRQERIGRFGKPFQMFKFRSMRMESLPGSQLTALGDPRVTNIGAWLRRTKIDELPQLLNVMLGNMSLVGPRPEVPSFTSRYTEQQRGVLDTWPGITGPSANIYEEELLAGQKDKENYYLNSILPKKLAIDLNYCRNICFRTDMHVLWLTFVKLLSRIYQPSTRSHQATHMPAELQADEE